MCVKVLCVKVCVVKVLVGVGIDMCGYRSVWVYVCVGTSIALFRYGYRSTWV